jgi:branched-chain amino acid transport system permease protein
VPIIGGMGTLFGPLLGAAGVHFISQVTRETMGDAPGIALALYGAILVLMVIFMPRGLAGLFRRFGRQAGDPESKAPPEIRHA